MKKTYHIFIEETLCKRTEVQAESMEEAEKIGIAMYRNSEIVLDSNDFSNEPKIMVEDDDSFHSGEGESTDWNEF